MMNSLSVAQLPVGYNGLSLEQLRARARRHVDEVCQNIISNLIQERMSIPSGTFMQVIWKWKCAEGSEGGGVRWTKDSLDFFSHEAFPFFIFLSYNSLCIILSFRPFNYSIMTPKPRTCKPSSVLPKWWNTNRIPSNLSAPTSTIFGRLL